MLPKVKDDVASSKPPSRSPRGLTITSTGGILHGQWVAEDPVSLSDRRLKKDVRPLKPSGAIDGLRPVAFSFTSSPGERRYGFLADEFAEALPALVRTLSDGFQGIVYQDLVAVLVDEVHWDLNRVYLCNGVTQFFQSWARSRWYRRL